jgi:type I restriction enzyme S subunit
MTATARQLPPDWQWVELGSLFEEERGQVQTGDADFDSLAFVGLENIESHTRRFILESPAKAESTCFRFDRSHVLYGKLRPYLDKVYVPNSPGKCCMEILPLKPAAGVSRAFLAAALQSKQVIGCAVKYSTGGRMPRADIRKLKHLCIPVPREEAARETLAAELQRKLSKVESMRQAAGRQADALGVAEQALLRDVFGRSGNSGWRRTSLGHLAEVVMGQSPEGSTYNREGKGLPLLNGPTEFGEDHPIPVQWTISPRKTGKTNDILICVRGNTTGRMNRADQVYCLGRGIAAIHGREGKGDTRFIRHAIRFKVAELLSGSERSTFPNIGKQDIEGFAVSAPPTVAEQAVMADQIEAELRVLNMISGAAARQSEAISALPGAILREAFDFAEEATA